MPCEVHFIDKCPVCKNHIPVKAELQPALPVTTVTETFAGTPTYIHIPSNAHPKPGTPEITDPAAKNTLQLAQEFAQAQNEVATIRSMVKNLSSHLTESQKQLEDAVRSCAVKQRALADAIAPQFSFPTTATAAAVRIQSEKAEDTDLEPIPAPGQKARG